MDTRNKRASALGFALAALVILPAPDAVIDQADRQQVTFSYSGISASLPIPIPNMTRARGVKVTPASMAMNVRSQAVSVAVDVKVT